LDFSQVVAPPVTSTTIAPVKKEEPSYEWATEMMKGSPFLSFFLLASH